MRVLLLVVDYRSKSNWQRTLLTVRIFSTSFLLTAVAGVLSLSTASAATITQTFTQPTSSPTTWSVANIPFNQFNPALGTLNSAKLSFGGSFSQTEVINVPVGVPAQTITGLSAVADVLIYDAANFVNQIIDISGSQNVISFPGVTIAAGTSQTFNAAGALGFGPASLLPLTPYIGLGTKSFSMAGTGGFSVSGGGQAGFAINTTSGGTLTLVYDYSAAPPSNPTPEPATFGMVGVAMAGLVYLRRKR